jgi:hypothetical protein
MNDLSLIHQSIPSMNADSIEAVRRVEDIVLSAPQIEISTDHVFHAGVYARTIMIPAGVVLTGALIRIPTILIVSGSAIVYVGEETKEISGYNVFSASSNRKQIFLAKTDVYLTMLFATEANTTEEAENEFTDEAERLSSRREDSINNIMISEG